MPCLLEAATRQQVVPKSYQSRGHQEEKVSEMEQLNVNSNKPPESDRAADHLCAITDDDALHPILLTLADYSAQFWEMSWILSHLKATGFSFDDSARFKSWHCVEGVTDEIVRAC
jgi:hypothetical protein